VNVTLVLTVVMIEAWAGIRLCMCVLAKKKSFIGADAFTYGASKNQNRVR
jgi:hypothetical protein